MAAGVRELLAAVFVLVFFKSGRCEDRLMVSDDVQLYQLFATLRGSHLVTLPEVVPDGEEVSTSSGYRQLGRHRGGRLSVDTEEAWQSKLGLADAPQCSAQQVSDGCCSAIGRSHWQTASEGGGSWSHNEHYIRFDFANSANCGGNASQVQRGVATLTFTAHESVELTMDMSGRAEAHYEHGHIFLDGNLVATMDATKGFAGETCKISQCQMCQVATPPATLYVSAGAHSLEVRVNSSDHLYHIGAYFQVSFLSKQSTCNGCKCSGNCANHDQAAVAVAARAGSTNVTGCGDNHVATLCQDAIHGLEMQLACPLVCGQCPPANCSNYDEVVASAQVGVTDCSDPAVPGLCEDPVDGLVVQLACPEVCGKCDAQPTCQPDDSSRRRSGRSCDQLFTNGQSSCRIATQSRRRDFGGEAYDFCQTTCSEYVGCKVDPNAAATPAPSPAYVGICPPDDSTRRRSGKSCSQLTTDGVTSCSVAMTSRRRNYGAEAYEFCKSTCANYLTDCNAANAPTTTTTPGDTLGDGNVSATDDPHLANLAGEKFSVNQPGMYTLLRVPLDTEEPAQLLVEANITGDGEKPCGLYIKMVVMSGDLLDGKTLLVRPMSRDRPGSNTAGTGVKNPFSMQVVSPEQPDLSNVWRPVGDSAEEAVPEAESPEVQVRALRREQFGKRVEAQAFEFRAGHAALVVSQASRQALNLQMSRVPALGAKQVGGLLGTARHDKAIEKFTPECALSRQQALDEFLDSTNTEGA